MGFDDGNFQEAPNKSEYEAWEARKARATKILEQIARANCGEDAIQPIMEILEQADAKNDLRAELNKKDLRIKELEKKVDGQRISIECQATREIELIRKLESKPREA